MVPKFGGQLDFSRMPAFSPGYHLTIYCMSSRDTQLPELFYAAVEQELDLYPGGISEYELIRALRARGFFQFLPPQSIKA